MSTESLFAKYQNIQKFIVDYRHYELKDKEQFLSFEKFSKRLQETSYIKHVCFDPKTKKDIIICFFKEDSKYVKDSTIFRSFMGGLIAPYEKTLNIEIILILKNPPGYHIKNNLFPYFNEMFPLHIYYHRYFIIELNKGAMCSVHTILNQEQINYLCSRELWVMPTNLPIIYADDPQCIWIGAKPGDVIKIQSLSDLTGKCIRYRYVTQIMDKFSEILEDDEDTKQVRKGKQKDKQSEQREDEDADQKIADDDHSEESESETEDEKEKEEPKDAKKKQGSFVDEAYADDAEDSGSDSSYSADPSDDE